MRYIFILLFIILAQTKVVFAQNKAQIPDSTLKKIAVDMCECFNERNNDGTINQKSIPNKEKIELCSGLVMLKYTNELPENVFSDKNISEELGRQMAPFLMRDCPKFIEYVSLQEEGERKAEEPKIAFVVYEGVFQKIKTKNYTFITIKNDAGKIEKFLWLNTFENDKLFINNPKNMRGKKIRITSSEINDMYDNKTKKYLSFKKIHQIEEVK